MGVILRQWLKTLLILPVVAQWPTPSPAQVSIDSVPPPGGKYQGAAFRFNRIKEGVIHAVGTGNLSVVSNAAIIINESDVLVVDTHISPAAAWALLRELHAVTAKPVTHVVNTHFHLDHSHGNQVYPPGIDVIGHEFTREMMASGKSKKGRAYDLVIGSIPGQIAGLQQRIDTTPPSKLRDSLQGQVTFLRNKLEANDAVVPTPPNTTLSQRMTLYRGTREIQLHFFGRGHTAGDVVVYLPQDSILITGDLLLPGIPFMGDAYFEDWVKTLEALKALNVRYFLPGHGPAFEGKDRIASLQAYITDLWAKASDLHKRGISAEEAARQIDMRSHASNYPNIRAVGADIHAVRRVYELLDGRP